MNLLNVGRNTASYNDPKVKKFRIIGDVLFFVGLAGIILTYYLFSKDVTEITVNGIGEFFKPPLLYLTIGFIVMVVGAIFSTISRIMAFVKSFKNGDNPIIMEKNRVMKEKERIEGEIDQLKEDYKNYNQNNNNE